MTVLTPLSLLKAGEVIRVRYKNWRGEVSIRNIELDGAPHWGSTERHPEPCWLICGTDIDKQECRVWSVADMEPTRVEWADSELDAALAECRRTHRGPGRCLLPEYLAARHVYHALLVQRGLLDPKLAERKPS